MKSLLGFSDSWPSFSDVLREIRNETDIDALEPDFVFPESVSELLGQLQEYWIVRCDGKHRDKPYTYHFCENRLKNVACGHTYSLWLLVGMAEKLTGYHSWLIPTKWLPTRSILMRTRIAIESCVHSGRGDSFDSSELIALQDSYGTQIMEELNYLIMQLKFLEASTIDNPEI
jgi:hypothetical protein